MPNWTSRTPVPHGSHWRSPVTTTACDCATDCARWAGRLNQLIADEVRAAVAADVLTGAEGDQLLTRLALVIDQAVSPARP
jgi:hypothetical protein